jgi:DNA anti-recombination protein RmuC
MRHLQPSVRTFEEELSELQTTLHQDFTKHLDALTAQASESTTRLTKQLNDLQFGNEEKLNTLRHLTADLERTEAGCMALGSQSEVSLLVPRQLDSELGRVKVPGSWRT